MPDPNSPEETAKRRGEKILVCLLPVPVSMLAGLVDVVKAYRPRHSIVISTQPEQPGTIEFRAVTR